MQHAARARAACLLALVLCVITATPQQDAASGLPLQPPSPLQAGASTALDFDILGPRDGDVFLLTPESIPLHLKGFVVTSEAGAADGPARRPHSLDGEVCVHGLVVPVANWDPAATPWDTLNEGLALVRACLADRLALWRGAGLPDHELPPPAYLTTDASVSSCVALGNWRLRNADPDELQGRVRGRPGVALDELVLRLGFPWAPSCTPFSGIAALRPLVEVALPRSFAGGYAALVALHATFTAAPDSGLPATPAAVAGRSTAFLHARPPPQLWQHVYSVSVHGDDALQHGVYEHLASLGLSAPSPSPPSPPVALTYLAYSDPYVRGVRASLLSLVAARLADFASGLRDGKVLMLRALDPLVMVGCKAPAEAWMAAAATSEAGAGAEGSSSSGEQQAPVPPLLKRWGGALASGTAGVTPRVPPGAEAAAVADVSTGAALVSALSSLPQHGAAPLTCSPMLSLTTLDVLAGTQALLVTLRRGLLGAALGSSPWPLAPGADAAAVPAAAVAAAVVSSCRALQPGLSAAACDAVTAFLNGSLPLAELAAVAPNGETVTYSSSPLSLAEALSSALPAPPRFLPVPWLQHAAEGLPVMGLDAGLWLKLHAWAAASSYSTALLLDSDTLIQGRLEPLWQALEAASPLGITVGGPALNYAEADNTVMNVQFVAFRPGLSAWEGYMAVLRRHAMFHLAETTFLNWYHWESKLTYLGHVCLAESLDVHTSDPSALAALAANGFGCPVLDFSSCTYNRFKPWQPREPPTGPGEYCRHPPGPLFKAAVAAWRAVDAAAAAAAPSTAA